MIRQTLATLTAVLVLGAGSALAAATVGETAPDFTATDIKGNEVTLSDHKGKLVVLEWTNHQCPFVVKHYDSGNMQEAQKKAAEMGAEWITIVSSAPEKQGHVSAEEAAKIAEEAGATVTAKILDESGEIGQLYGAKTTPHMYVIDAEGKLAYAGAIDSVPSANPADVEDAENYVLAALNSLVEGDPVETAETKPYGCSVKY